MGGSFPHICAFNNCSCFCKKLVDCGAVIDVCQTKEAEINRKPSEREYSRRIQGSNRDTTETSGGVFLCATPSNAALSSTATALEVVSGGSGCDGRSHGCGDCCPSAPRRHDRSRQTSWALGRRCGGKTFLTGLGPPTVPQDAKSSSVIDVIDRRYSRVRLKRTISGLRLKSADCGGNFQMVRTILELCPQFQDCGQNPQIVSAIFKWYAQFWNCLRNFRIADTIVKSPTWTRAGIYETRNPHRCIKA